MVNEFAIIVACTSKGGIGYKNDIPWHIPADLKHFKDVTTNAPIGQVNAVIMGKNTWLSLPQKHKPLINRLNIVVSSTLTEHNICENHNIIIVPSLQNAIKYVITNKIVYNAFVIGGARLYNEALLNPLFKKAYITQVHINSEPEFDTFIDLSIIKSNFTSYDEGPNIVYDNNICYRFCEFSRI